MGACIPRSSAGCKDMSKVLSKVMTEGMSTGMRPRPVRLALSMGIHHFHGLCGKAQAGDPQGLTPGGEPRWLLAPGFCLAGVQRLACNCFQGQSFCSSA